jgi:hypothetical protein
VERIDLFGYVFSVLRQLDRQIVYLPSITQPIAVVPSAATKMTSSVEGIRPIPHFSKNPATGANKNASNPASARGVNT